MKFHKCSQNYLEIGFIEINRYIINFPMNDLAQLTKAATFAAKKHTRQKRKGANSEPYINHPLEVADLLSRVGKIEDCDILTAAILHDVLEDTDTCEDEIERLFGTKVCN